MNTRILFVDDEQNILDGIKRQLRNSYEIVTANSASDALTILEKDKNFSVIVSDMRMPGKDLKYPQIVRVMLTGNADQDSAVKAINRGKIFRFVNKPYEKDDLVLVLNDAVSQHKLITAEKDLLTNTLSGSIKLLTDLLSMIDSESFGEVGVMRDTTRKICRALNIETIWEIELAVMLQDVGRVLIPPHILSKIKLRKKLNSQEFEIASKIPITTYSLLKNIPRLEKIAEIILYSHKNFDGTGIPETGPIGEEIPLGSRLLRIINEIRYENKIDLDKLFELKGRPEFDQILVDELREIFKSHVEPQQGYKVKYKELCPGQVLIENIESKDGRLLVAKGATISESMLSRLSNYVNLVGLREPIIVDTRIPTINSNV
jgi:response regulator RpfG family c-di-GMP phosphodiesterase